MPSPTLITIFDAYLDAAGMPLNGTVTFTPVVDRLAATDAAVIAPLAVQARVSGGVLEARLAAHDSVVPSGWSYKVVEKFAGVTYPPYYITVAAAMPARTRLSTLTPTGAPGAVNRPWVSSLNGRTGDVTLELGAFSVMDYYDPAGGATAGIAAVTAAVAAATAVGGGDILFPASATPLTLATPIQLDGGLGHRNLTFRGAGREATQINCAQGFIVAINNADACRVEDMGIACTTATNTHNGIDVTYPRHWFVTGCLITGFGGDSIRYRGGLNSGTARNYIIARDPNAANGHAGISFTATDAAVAGTTCRSDQDYVGAGVQYGFYFANQVATTVIGPIAEGVQTGIRFVVCSRGSLVDPYTEATSVSSVEMSDTHITMIGGTLTVGQPVTRTWSGVAFDDRAASRIGRNTIDTGKGLIFGGTAGEIDPALAPSIRAGSGTPEGVVTGVVGSLWLRTNGGPGATLYRKETGTGNTGWVTTA